MSTTQLFLLPDLGEGLPDAEIVEWHVAVGQVVRLDDPLVSMETAKAVVDVPAPCSGTLLRVAGKAGDVITTGAWLAEFELDPNLPQRAAGHDTGHAHGAGHAPAPTAAASPVAVMPPMPSLSASDLSNDLPEGVTPAFGGGFKNATPALAAPAPTPAVVQAQREDAGTVVGAMQVSSEVRREAAVAVGGIKAVPAVRALAKKLGVDLARITPTGAEGVVTMADVKRAAERGEARLGNAPAVSTAQPVALSPPPPDNAADAGFDTDAPIRGVRRNMVRSMAAAHAEVVPTTLMDDADLHAWSPGEDITVRLIRSLVVASASEPAMNAWLNAKEGTLRRHSRVDVGIAIDHADGLFVANLRGADRMDASAMRAGISRLRDGLKDRSLPAEELSGYTIMLSNFGKFAGKYATPVVVPPCVCIVAAGRLYHGVVPVLGGIETHRLMPLSLTFDHRAATGGEAARFLKAMIDDLQRAR
ncbi:dihydrolipoamide acetyltransferase family protein [Silanimonas sp.]|jgi:pyruvate dehydrogenase E2 component (dihydrolipoamide acetyltransferase)|uniref:dihydrolipoamide acetyltransferase family protein n=1 Tax=Silanimonas sp. TaxID=1929290 RepID=UPI0022BA81F2|nr:dihydrolipoamide acetyltransferase family protein [Silanimonas sp.]MCZ8114185.1 dihydrolipoamide acetyltransferase family protein [Silanimonas sp.]